MKFQTKLVRMQRSNVVQLVFIIVVVTIPCFVKGFTFTNIRKSGFIIKGRQSSWNDVPVSVPTTGGAPDRSPPNTIVRYDSILLSTKKKLSDVPISRTGKSLPGISFRTPQPTILLSPLNLFSKRVEVISDQNVDNPASMTTYRQTEFVTRSIAGIVLIGGVLITLATDDTSVIDTSTSTGLPPGVTIETLEVVSLNIIDAALPLTMSDVVSITVGEAIASFIGALSSFFISTLFKWNDARRKCYQTVNNPVADGDFLLTQAAAIPLLEIIGFTPVLATFTSVGLAIIPSTFVKLGALKKQQLIEKDRLIQQLLLQQLEREEEERKKSQNILYSITALNIPIKATNPTTTDINTLQPILDSSNSTVRLDFVEVFTDITKWLQFNILTNDFDGALDDLFFGSDPFPGEESAVYGSIATVSSQLYSDVLYGYFGYGGETKREMIRQRSVQDWNELYLNKVIYAATLFGVYELVQAPARFIVNAFLSGGVEACLGSAELNACIETYVAFNTPGPTPEAQLRSLITRLYSIWYNSGFADFFPPSFG